LSKFSNQKIIIHSKLERVYSLRQIKVVVKVFFFLFFLFGQSK